MIFFLENCLLYVGVHDFLVWLRTYSNPADIIQFRSHFKLYLKEAPHLWLERSRDLAPKHFLSYDRMSSLLGFGKVSFS